MKRTEVAYSKWATNNSHKYGMKKIGLFIANGQRMNYICTGYRDLGLFIANGHRINYICTGYRDLGLFIANGQRIIYTSMG